MSRSSQRSTIKDMTNGSPAKLILGFAVPMLMGLLFQQFYSMVDTIIVGKFLGVDALASVGSTSAINFMINGFVIGVCTGFSIPVAQRFGAQDYKDMRRFVANAGWIASCFAVVMTVIVCLMTRQILVWMQTPDNIIDGAYSYIFFVFAGIPATYLYNTLAGIIRALGDSKTPVYFLILSSLLNIALDLLFIVQIGTGTAGAAYATVISQAVSGILCLIYMKKKFEILHMHHEETRISGRHIYILCKMGVPMGLQYSITAIGSVVIQTAINSLGSIAVASVTAGQKIGMFFCCPFDALCAAAARALRWGGRFFLVHKPERLVDLMTGLRAARLEPKRIRFVRHRAENAVNLVLIEARLGGGPGLQFEPDLVLYTQTGELSAAGRRIYHLQE